MNRPTLVLLTVFLVSPVALAQGTLRVGEPTVEGKQVVVPIVLGGEVGAGVSALDFRLHYNPEALRPVSATAGVAASRADKQVMANASAPGEYIVVMMGMNQGACQTGEVARVVMERLETDAGNRWNLGITRQTLSGADGAPIASTVLPASESQDGTGNPERSEKAAGQGAQQVGGQALVTRAVAAAVPGGQVPPEVAEQAPAGDGTQTAPEGSGQKEILAALDARDRARARIPSPGGDRPPGATHAGAADASDAPRDSAPAPGMVARAQSDTRTVEATNANVFGPPVAAGVNPPAARGASRPALWVAGAAAAIAAGLAGLRAWRRRRLG